MSESHAEARRIANNWKLAYGDDRRILARAYLALLTEQDALRAERDHYRDHSPANRISFKRCEAYECIEARAALPTPKQQEDERER